jgi:hypothetical protein
VSINSTDRMNLQELLKKIAEYKADTHPEEWKKDDEDDSDLRRAIAAAMNQHGWPGDGIPGALPHVLRMIEDEKIAVRSTFNDMPPTDVSEVKTNPANWYLSVDDAHHVADCLGAKPSIHAMHTPANGPPLRPGVPSKDIISKFHLPNEWKDRLKHIAHCTKPLSR